MSWYPHVTVATIVKNQDHFLLVEKQANGREVLNQPIEHLESIESLLKAALCKTLEGTGWEVGLSAATGIYLYTVPSNGVTYQRVCFAVHPVRHHPEHVLGDGIIGPRWLTRDELAAQPQCWRSHPVLRYIDDYLAGSHHPLALTHDTHVSPSLLQIWQNPRFMNPPVTPDHYV